MAIIHRAYSFNPTFFHSTLEAKLIEHDQFRLSALLDLAKAIVSNASEPIKQALEDIRFDGSWFNTLEDEASHTNEWYIIALASHLSPAPSLSNRLQVSHLVLKLILPLTGWTNVEMKLMLRGESLDTLVESSGNDFFINEFRGIGQYGGWLGLEDVKLLLSRLRQVEKHFAYPNHEAVNILANLAGLWSQSPAEMMSKAYADAIEMLQTAINRNSALFVLLD